MNKDRFLRLLIVALIVCFWSMPALAAKDALSDEALDEITAAGDSQVAVADATAGGSADVNLVDNAQFTLSMPTNAQVGLRALTVQNVVGEVQLLVNMNVLSANNNVAGTDQRNFGVQSWGSTAPLTTATVPAVAGGNGGNAATGGIAVAVAAPDIHPVVGTACVTGVAGCNGSQTNDPTIQVPVAVVANAPAAPGGPGAAGIPGQIGIGLGTGDGIAFAVGNCTDGNHSDPCAQADVVNNPNYNLAFQPNAQVNLATLFVANIVGRAQTIFNVNIASSTLNLIPDAAAAGQPFASPVADAGVIKQVNSGIQFRGSPLGFSPNANINIDVKHTNQ